MTFELHDILEQSHKLQEYMFILMVMSFKVILAFIKNAIYKQLVD